MAKYFKNVKSYEDLKEQFKSLARKNHPDAGGDDEIMKEINAEYDQLFPVWKHRYTDISGEQTTETANSTRSEFYTSNGWKGSKHNWSRTTKEVAALVRAYVKEIYPGYKFSVRFSSASMCSEVHVELKEAPHGLYKSIDDLSKEDIDNIHKKLRANHLFNKDSWFDHELKTAIVEAWKLSDFYKVYDDITTTVIEDVNREVNSYNFNDCDAMTDYFHVDFYYFGCKVSDDFKVVEKTARIKNKAEITAPAATGSASVEEYNIKESIHTKTGAKIWLVKIVRALTREEYLVESKKMDRYGGYYSKFTHSFVFDHDPTEELKGEKVA